MTRNALLFSTAISMALLSACSRRVEAPPVDAAFVFPDAGRDAATRPDASMPTPCDSAGDTLGDSCTTTAACDDGCFCNGVEVCSAGVCTAGVEACVVGECGSVSCDEADDVCAFVPDDPFCDDGNACNGAERCDVRDGCRAGVPPTCNDADICTIDYCDTTLGCVFEPIDRDGDGVPARSCGGTDCNDDDPEISPATAEVCDNRIDDDCNGLTDLDEPACSGVNDTCATAVDVTPPGLGTFRTRSSTMGFVADYTLGCPSSTSDSRLSGPDAVFRFTLDTMRDVTIRVEGVAYNAAVFLRAESECAAGPDLKCAAPSGSTTEPLLHRRRLPAGDYVVIVKTRTPLAFTLALTVEDPSPTQTDVCADDTLDISAGGTFAGAFDDHDYGVVCHSLTSQYYDAAFRLVVPAGEFRDVHLTATARLTSGSASTPYIHLTSACGRSDGAVSECNAGTTTRPAELLVRGLPEGVYFVVLENSSTTSSTPGSYSLDAMVTPAVGRAPGDSCELNVPVLVTETTPGVVDLAALDAPTDAGEFCGANRVGYRDAFFTFTLGAERDVLIETTSTARHWVGRSSTCGVVTSAIDCMASSSGTATRRFVRLPAGVHFLDVSTLAESGTITASITTFDPTPVPPNDACSGAALVDDGSATDLALSDYTDDVDATCGGTDALDAWYTFTLASDRFVTLRAEGARSMALYGSTCGGTAALCVTTSPPQITQVLTAGVYYVAVEAPPLEAGAVRLRFTTADP